MNASVPTDEALADSSLNIQRNKLLLAISSGKRTVGTLLLYKKDSALYALLGRESEGSGIEEKTGIYCDLGGIIKNDGSSFLDNLERE